MNLRISEWQNSFVNISSHFPLFLILLRNSIDQIDLLEKDVLISLQDHDDQLLYRNGCLFRNRIFAQWDQL